MSSDWKKSVLISVYSSYFYYCFIKKYHLSRVLMGFIAGSYMQSLMCPFWLKPTHCIRQGSIQPNIKVYPQKVVKMMCYFLFILTIYRTRRKMTKYFVRALKIPLFRGVPLKINKTIWPLIAKSFETSSHVNVLMFLKIIISLSTITERWDLA